MVYGVTLIALMPIKLPVKNELLFGTRFSRNKYKVGFAATVLSNPPVVLVPVR